MTEVELMDEGAIGGENQLNTVVETLASCGMKKATASAGETTHWWLLKKVSTGELFGYFGTPESYRLFIGRVASPDPSQTPQTETKA